MLDNQLLCPTCMLVEINKYLYMYIFSSAVQPPVTLLNLSVIHVHVHTLQMTHVEAVSTLWLVHHVFMATSFMFLLQLSVDCPFLPVNFDLEYTPPLEMPCILRELCTHYNGECTVPMSHAMKHYTD